MTVARHHIEAVTRTNAHGIRILYSKNVRVLDDTIVDTSWETVYGYRSDNLEVSRNRVGRASLYGLYFRPSAQRLVVAESLISDWPPTSPGILLDGIRRSAVRANVFQRGDQARPTPNPRGEQLRRADGT